MNVNLQTRIAGQGGMPVIDAPTLTGEGVKQKADDVSLNVTENKSSGPLGQPNPQELDPPEGDLRMTPGRLDKTLEKLSDTPVNLGDKPVKPNDTPVNLGDGNPSPAPSKPLSSPARITTAFNIVAILDLIQTASNEMSRVVRDMNINEHKHKAKMQEQTAEIIRQTGEASASAAMTSAILGSVMTGVGAVLSGIGFREQYKAFAKADVKTTELAAKEATDMLKEVKDFKKVAGTDELLGKYELPKDVPVEMKEIPSQSAENIPNQPAENLQKPEVTNSTLFREPERIVNLSAAVHKRGEEVVVAKKAAEKSALGLNDARKNVNDFKPGDLADPAMQARKELNAKWTEHEQKQADLQDKVDGHISACQEFKRAMEADISAKQTALSQAKTPAEKQRLQGELTRMQSVYHKECSKMGDALETSLNQKVVFTHAALDKAQMQVQNTEEMAWAKGFETAAGIVRQGFEAGQGFAKMHGDEKEASKREQEHLAQASETRADSDIEMSKHLREDWNRVQQMVIELRKMAADLEYQTMNSIFKG